MKLFDTADYNAENTFKIIGENCYKSLIKNDAATKEGILRARQDWKITNILPDDEETDAFWRTALYRNQNFKNLCMSLSNTKFSEWPYDLEEKTLKKAPIWKGKLICGIYSNDTEDFLGFSMETVVYQNHYTLFTCFLPEYRDMGYNTEINIAGAKYIFQTCDYKMSEGRIPMEFTEDSIMMDMALKFTPEDKEIIDRGFPVKYATVLLSQKSFTEWLSENPDWANAPYSYEQLYDPK